MKMKYVRLTQIIPPKEYSRYTLERMYKIPVGNSAYEYFGSEKAAKQFLADLNRILNSRLHELNFTYGMVFCEIRRAWLFASHSDEKYLDDNDHIIQSAFKYITKNPDTPNAHQLVIRSFYTIINTMIDSLQRCKCIFESRKFYSDVQRTKFFMSQLQAIHENLIRRDLAGDSTISLLSDSESTQPGQMDSGGLLLAPEGDD